MLYLDFLSLSLTLYFPPLFQNPTFHLVVTPPEAPLGCDSFSDLSCF